MELEAELNQLKEENEKLKQTLVKFSFSSNIQHALLHSFS